MNFQTRIVHWVYQLLRLQAMLVIGLCFMQMLFFGGISLIAPLANIVAVPVITLIVLPLALLATLCDQLSMFQLSYWVFNVVDLTLTMLIELLIWISNVDFAWQGLAFSRWLVLIIISSVVFFILRFVKANYSLYILCLMMTLIFGFITNRLMIDVRAWRIDFLDVGHGNSSVIQKGNRGIVIDTGNVLGEHSTMAQNIVIPFIAQQDIQQIDYIIVTHHDSDHSAGFKLLVERFPHAQVITNRDATCKGGYFEWQGLAIKLTKALGKLPKSHDTENNRSCLIHIKNE